MTVIGNTETTDVSLVMRSIEGNVIHLCYKITGDGSSDRFVCAMSHVTAHAVGVINAAAGLNPAITYTEAAGGATVIYAIAPLDDVSHFLHLWGY